VITLATDSARCAARPQGATRTRKPTLCRSLFARSRVLPRPFILSCMDENDRRPRGPSEPRDRHNVGFWFVSRLAAARRIELKSVAKYHGLLGKLALASGDLWLFSAADLHERLGQVGRRARALLQIPASGSPGRARRARFPSGTAKQKLGGGGSPATTA